MKKLGFLLLAMLLLTGCGAPVDYETMADVYVQAELPMPAELLVALPPDAAVMTGADGSSKIWLCDGYTVTAQTLASGDLDATLRSVTGFGREQLSLVELQSGTLRRWEWVWTCAGEGGDQVCRGVILDDGAYHYVLSLQTDAQLAGELSEAWREIVGSFSLDIVP